jgi:hypothetical protein
MAACISCEKTDQQVPLLQMVYQGKEVFICPQCLPVLIHKPEKLEEKLLGMKPGKPAEH